MPDELRSRLATRYHLTITVLSPVHIGAGGAALKAGIPDFRTVDGRIMVLDPGKFDQRQIDQLNQGRSYRDIVADMTVAEIKQVAAYSLPDAGDVNAILPHIKLLDGRPYIPGSSIKGAIRTALAYAMLRAGGVEPNAAHLGWRRERADDQIDRDLFGQDPNHDLLRVLNFGDSSGTSANHPIDLRRAYVFSLVRRQDQAEGAALKAKTPLHEFSFCLEVISEGAVLQSTLRRDNHLMNPMQADQLGFSSRRDFVANLAPHCNAFARTLIERESDFYQRYGPRPLVTFYESLDKRLNQIDPDNEFLIQIAWGTGWQAKTLGLALGDGILRQIREKYALGRDNAPFPKSRRLVSDAHDRPMALGWLCVSASAVGEADSLSPLAR